MKILMFLAALQMSLPAYGDRLEGAIGATERPCSGDSIISNGPYVVPDYTGTVVRLASRNVSYYINDKGSADLSFGDVTTAIKAAANSWQTKTSVNITFQFADKTSLKDACGDHQNVFFWDDDGSFVPSIATAATVTTIDRNTGLVIDSDVGFNAKSVLIGKNIKQIKWVIAGLGSDVDPQCTFELRYCADLQGVATHEIGHMLGLGHSEVKSSVMYSPPQGGHPEVGLRTLKQDDLKGIFQLYGSGFTLASGDRTATDGQPLTVSIPAGSAEASITLSMNRSASNAVGGEITLDGAHLFSILAGASFTFATGVGTHAVSLSVQDGLGVMSRPASSAIVVLATNQPPTAGFVMSSGNQSKTEGQTLSLSVPPNGTASVTFDATTRSSAVNGATITAWQWTVDNAVVSTASTFQRSFSSGNHTISLIVTDSRGAQSAGVAGTVAVSVSQPPTAGLTMSSGTKSATDGQTLNLTVPTGGTATIAFDSTTRSFAANGRTITGWFWTINVVTVPVATTATFSKTLGPGTYTVMLVVTDDLGANSTPASATIVVIELAATWTLKSASGPTVSSVSGILGMAFDIARGNLVLAALQGSSFQTWTWDGRAWTQLAPTNSPPATRFEIAYDESLQRVIANGSGSAGGPQMWAWDGVNWTQLFPQVNPVGINGVTSGSNLGYDATRAQLLTDVFVIGTIPQQYETWAWSGGDWTKVASSPAAQGIKAFDRQAAQVVLVGCELCVPFGAYTTWLWNGVAWNPAANTQTFSSQFFRNLISYHAGLGKVLLFTNDAAPQTFMWDGTSWNHLASNPSLGVAMTYDTVRKQMVLVAASAGVLSTWVL